MSELGATSPTRDSAREKDSGSQDTRRGADGPSPGTDHASKTATIEKPAEQMTRGEYREQMHRGPSAGADDPAGHVDSPGERGEARERSADRGEFAESLTRGEYHEQIRQGPAAQAHRPNHHAGSPTSPDRVAKPASGRADVAERSSDKHDIEDKADRGQHGRNDPSPNATSRVARNGAGEASPDVREKQSPSDGKVTHFHSEFKGETLDLYTDGSRWATIEHPRREDMVAVKPDVPDRLPTGEELVEGAGEDDSRLEKLRRELYRESDDAIDAVDKSAGFAHDIFSPPPTGSLEGMPVNHPYITEAPHAGIDPGNMATALFTFGLVIDRGIRWAMGHYGQHRQKE